MRHKMLIFLFFSIYHANTINSAALQPDPFLLRSQCHGLDPVYNGNGSLSGYRGVCNVDKWTGGNGQLDSMHPLGNNLNLFTPPVSVKFKQPSNNSLFDWLSPHHDIIRNHPHYRRAHLQHRHCIHKKQKGLLEYLGEFFGFTSDGNEQEEFDPYTGLPTGSRCLDPQYYMDNPFSANEPYSLHLTRKIRNIKRQLSSVSPDHFDGLRNDLNSHYDRLNRHLDCHCHHELPRSQRYKIHHRPIGFHSMETISQPSVGSFPSKIYSPMQFDPQMDMEDEHMAMLRMSGLAAQQAYQQQPALDTGILQMQMFHPVNSYGIDPEWGKLRVEKVIVIKRLKVPVIKNVPVPVPVPVPYPVPGLDLNSSSNGQYSQYDNIQPGYIGNNTYITDSVVDGNNPMLMDSVVQAISGVPCGCMNHGLNGYSGYGGYGGFNGLNGMSGYDVPIGMQSNMLTGMQPGMSSGFPFGMNQLPMQIDQMSMQVPMPMPMPIGYGSQMPYPIQTQTRLPMQSGPGNLQLSPSPPPPPPPIQYQQGQSPQGQSPQSQSLPPPPPPPPVSLPYPQGPPASQLQQVQR